MATLKEQMTILAREIRVTDEFVEQVRAIFEHCGVSMSDDATPHLAQLQDTFRTEAAIQNASVANAKKIERLNKKIQSLKRTHTRTISELNDAVQSLRRSAAKLRSRSASMGWPLPILCPGPSEMQ